MGQYYKPVNIDTYEGIYSWDYGCGLKLMEHSWLKNPMVNIVMDLISIQGRWGKCRLVWAGDYMDKGKFLPKDADMKLNLYEYHHNIEKINPIDGPMYKCIVNHDKKLYVDLTNLKSVNGWAIHPLPLLTCSGNGRGGGDYDGTYMKLVGSWAGNRVSSAYDIPDGFKKLKVNFIENR